MRTKLHIGIIFKSLMNGESLGVDFTNDERKRGILMR